MSKPKWKTRDGSIDLEQMTPEHLQAAYNYSEQRYMYWQNRAEVFSRKMDELEAEAERRGITLKSVDEMKQMGSMLGNRRKVAKLKRQKPS